MTSSQQENVDISTAWLAWQMAQDVHVKLNPELPWQKRFNKKRIYHQ
jgi:hypothetical protein